MVKVAMLKLPKEEFYGHLHLKFVLNVLSSVPPSVYNRKRDEENPTPYTAAQMHCG